MLPAGRTYHTKTLIMVAKKLCTNSRKGARHAVVELWKIHKGDLDRVVTFSRKSRRFCTKWIDNYRTHGNVDDIPRSGRRKCLDQTQQQALTAAVLQKQSVGVAVKALQAQGIIQHSCHVSTAYRVVRKELDLRTADPRPILSAATKAKRIRFSKAKHRVGNLVAVDSTYFTLHAAHARRRLWVKKGTKPTRPSPVKSQQLHVYAGISKHGKTSLIFATGTTGLGKRYYKVSKQGRKQPLSGVGAAEFIDILQQHLLPQACSLMNVADQPPPTFLLDGAPCHTAQATKDFCAANGIQLINAWPPNSPDLNPIENLWAWMKNKVYAHPYKSLAELQAAVLDAWQAVPKRTLQNLMRSFNTRKGICIQRHGGYTGY